MPLNSLEDYKRLGEHLETIDNPLQAFATAYDYTVAQLGRYPNRRLTKNGVVTHSIEIAMDRDEHGKCFDEFFPEIPYLVWGGAWIDDLSNHTRFTSPHLRTYAIPFSTIARHLTIYLDHFHSYLSTLTEDYIRTYGTASRLVIGPAVSDL